MLKFRAYYFGILFLLKGFGIGEDDKKDED